MHLSLLYSFLSLKCAYYFILSEESCLFVCLFPSKVTPISLLRPSCTPWAELSNLEFPIMTSINYLILLCFYVYINLSEFPHLFSHYIVISRAEILPFELCIPRVNTVSGAQGDLGKNVFRTSGRTNCVHFNKWVNECTGVINYFHPWLKAEQN